MSKPPANRLDVFDLRDQVIDEYKSFATSFTKIHAADLRIEIDKIYADGRYWPEPLIQINPNYQEGTSVATLVKQGDLDPACEQIFRGKGGAQGAPTEALTLYRHQQEAIGLASSGRSYVVTTGTGSGKSLCFFIPMVSAILTEKRADPKPRTRAIIIYPMNALANSQLEEIKGFLENVPGDRKPITVRRYTGQEKDEERQQIAANPPDILLTNFMMLELLMTRQDPIDRDVIGNCAGLRFLVLDELHTYRGRQGADVALLVRRVRERLSPDRLQCIGTSATMSSQGSQIDKCRAVAEVASRLFAAPIDESDVIVERLKQNTQEGRTADKVAAELGAAIDAGISPSVRDAELRKNALAIWVETTLGIYWHPIDQQWVRAKPMTLTEAVTVLARASGRPEPRCKIVLLELLGHSSTPESDRTSDATSSNRAFFAFKLHQFISGAGHAYATLEPPGKRVVTVEAQAFLPAEREEDRKKRLYPVHFCRNCGHEYHPVKLVTKDGQRLVLPRNIDDAPPIAPKLEKDEDPPPPDPDADRFGFLSPDDPADAGFFEDQDDKYPEDWFETTAKGVNRLKATFRDARPVPLDPNPDGTLGGSARWWFLPGKFRLCLRCGETQSGSGKDRSRLASLSAEGRSSATTVLVGSALRWMHGPDSGLDTHKRKLLGFTDNRQDAALQAGHFNDFLFVSMVRAGFLGALDAAGPAGLGSAELGLAQQRALGFDRTDDALRAEWLLDPSATRGFGLKEAEETLRQVLAYRVWFDQRRGWRYSNPNLEDLGLVRVEYEGIDVLAADEEVFRTAPPILQRASAKVRRGLYALIFDHLRKWMAIRSLILDPGTQEQLKSRSHNHLRAPWGFSRDDQPRIARWLMVAAPARRENNLRDEDLLVRASSRSALARELKRSEYWDGDDEVRTLKPKERDELLIALLDAARRHHLVLEDVTPFGGAKGYQLNESCVRFHRNRPEEDRVKHRFFRAYYANLAALLRSSEHPLFGFEAREHTAQVDQQKRQVREQRFRYGVKERAELEEKTVELREIGESSRFLPVMFCSPTMELGVDISELNTVYLRNVPPTPANYAQRAGRAGRSGQAALVITYCSSQGPHDQYFFREPRDMVHGEVRPPHLDLANRELVESHLHAVWLAATEQKVDGSIAKVLQLENRERPLRDDLRAGLSVAEKQQDAVARVERVLAYLEEDLTAESAPWYHMGRAAFAAQLVQAALKRFDEAFRRWRDLLSAAEAQRDAARRVMDQYGAPPKERDHAKGRHNQAVDQIKLLEAGDSTASSDFYTYRYLATEGFLPGYNFPRLPLMAYVPASNDGRKQTYLQRPRFLALSEFGPRSLVYHEGRAYRVVRAMLAVGQRDSSNPNAQLPTWAARLCKACGAEHRDEQVSLCHACGVSLDGADVIRDIFRIENVATQPAERITANEEERRRQGFEIQTTFRWALRDGAFDVRLAEVRDEDGLIATLGYGPGATITRLNKGLRRRANRSQLGFVIDPLSGAWAKNEDDDDQGLEPGETPKQRIVPSVEDHKNALLLQLAHAPETDKTVATLQHALVRGLELVFELEQGELLAEPMPNRDARTGFLIYEATEGGAGVLTRLVSEPGKIAEVARKALRVLHFEITADALPTDPSKLADATGTACVAGCYKCLLSYYNQPDHEIIDRRDTDTRGLLLRLARATTAALHASGPPPSEGDKDPLLAALDARGIPAPDGDPLVLDGVTLPFVWRAHYVVAVLGAVLAKVLRALEDQGFEVVRIDEDRSTWTVGIEPLARLLAR